MHGVIWNKYILIEGSLEVKLPTIWTDEKQRWSRRIEKRRAEERRAEERRSEKRKSQKKEDTGARKGSKVAKHCVFPMIWGSGGSKSKLAKVAGAEPAGQRRDEKLHAVVAGARDCGSGQKWAKREGFVAFQKSMAGVGHLKRIWKDAFSVAGAVQETCSSELLGGPGADFLRGVAFWSLRSSGLLRWFCVTGAALRMTWHYFFVVGAVV